MMHFFEDLWAPLESSGPPPSRRLIAQTDRGVTGVVVDFVEEFVHAGHKRAANEKCDARALYDRTGRRPDSFRDAFLHLAGLTNEGLIVIISKDGGVRSADAGAAGCKSVPLKREEARQRFADGTMAVVVDYENEHAVTAYAWEWKELSLAIDVAPPVAASSKEPLELSTHELVAAARTALLSGRWGLPQSTPATVSASPSTAV